MARVSIIIPAHNEAAVIENTLSVLLDGNPDPDREIIVVCNGCTDDSAAIASSCDGVRVIETPVASKANALNLGDEIASGGIRVYLDADVTMRPGSIRELIDRMADRDLLAASPNINMDLTEASWPVRAYYRTWLKMPFMQQGFMGAGVYAVSATGRARFDRFPDVISDDGFVRGCFAADEAGRVEQAVAKVRAPKTLGGLLKIKARSRLGQYQLVRMFPEMREIHRTSVGGVIYTLMKNPLRWPESFVYLAINIVCRLRARKLLRDIASYEWETESSSRASITKQP